MTTAGHAAAMRECIADSCKQGRAACPTPMQCSGAAPLVDESIDHFRLHRLQDVRPTVYLAPGVVEGPGEDDFLRQDNALFACVRSFGIAVLLWVAASVAVAYLLSWLGWLA